MKTSDFTYTLPEHLIAKTPPAVRGNACLLCLNKTTGAIKDRAYRDFTDWLTPGDIVILNDTRVIPARLLTRKQSSHAVRELVLLEQHGMVDDWYRHRVLYRRSLHPGDVLVAADATKLVVEAVLDDGIAVIKSPIDLLVLAEKIGTVPLPPYLHREATKDDRSRYQTVWAKHDGSVAAPTASLNMVPETLQAIAACGASVHYATLHVGLGTFLPIRVEDLAAHTMHKEYFEIPKSTVAAIQKAKAAHKQVIAIGTTITRTLEYAAEQILHYPATDLYGEADIFIYPGYQFKVVDALLTNFHAPSSTVLMLTAAFAGWEHLRLSYAHAVEQGYKFLSYGDSMFIYSDRRHGSEL